MYIYFLISYRVFLEKTIKSSNIEDCIKLQELVLMCYL